jgi:hypothetical protein
VTAIRHCSLIALGVFSAAAYLEAVLFLDFSRRKRGLLTSEQDKGCWEHQREKASAYGDGQERLAVLLVVHGIKRYLLVPTSVYLIRDSLNDFDYCNP